MRRIAIFAAATVSVVVLLFSHRTSTEQTPVAAGRPLGGGDQPSRTTTPSPSGGFSGPSAGADGTFTGSVADTRYGPVLVRITVAGWRITDAPAVGLPQESSRGIRINSAAVPVLVVEDTPQAQGSRIDAVSGATYTSEDYQQSLQPAIYQAHR